MSEMRFVPAAQVPAEFSDKKCRKWLVDMIRATIKAITSTMQALDVLKDTLFIWRDFLQKLELAISQEVGEL